MSYESNDFDISEIDDSDGVGDSALVNADTDHLSGNSTIDNSAALNGTESSTRQPADQLDAAADGSEADGDDLNAALLATLAELTEDLDLDDEAENSQSQQIEASASKQEEEKQQPSPMEKKLNLSMTERPTAEVPIDDEGTTAEKQESMAQDGSLPSPNAAKSENEQARDNPTVHAPSLSESSFDLHLRQLETEFMTTLSSDDHPLSPENIEEAGDEANDNHIDDKSHTEITGNATSTEIAAVNEKNTEPTQAKGDDNAAVDQAYLEALSLISGDFDDADRQDSVREGEQVSDPSSVEQSQPTTLQTRAIRTPESILNDDSPEKAPETSETAVAAEDDAVGDKNDVDHEKVDGDESAFQNDQVTETKGPPSLDEITKDVTKEIQELSSEELSTTNEQGIGGREEISVEDAVAPGTQRIALADDKDFAIPSNDGLDADNSTEAINANTCSSNLEEPKEVATAKASDEVVALTSESPASSIKAHDPADLSSETESDQTQVKPFSETAPGDSAEEHALSPEKERLLGLMTEDQEAPVDEASQQGHINDDKSGDSAPTQMSTNTAEIHVGYEETQAILAEENGERQAEQVHESKVSGMMAIDPLDRDTMDAGQRAGGNPDFAKFADDKKSEKHSPDEQSTIPVVDEAGIAEGQIPASEKARVSSSHADDALPKNQGSQEMSADEQAATTEEEPEFLPPTSESLESLAGQPKAAPVPDEIGKGPPQAELSESSSSVAALIQTETLVCEEMTPPEQEAVPAPSAQGNTKDLASGAPPNHFRLEDSSLDEQFGITPANELKKGPASEMADPQSPGLEEGYVDELSSVKAAIEMGKVQTPTEDEGEGLALSSHDSGPKISELEESSSDQQSSPSATTQPGESKVPPAEELEVPLPASDDVGAKSSELEESSSDQQSSPAATTETGESKVPPAEELEVPLPASDDVGAKSSELEESSSEQQSSPAATTETGESKVPPAEELGVPLPASDDVEAKSSELEESSAEQQSSPAATTETGESKVPPAEELAMPLPASDDVEAKSSELEESSAEQQSSPAATTETGESKVPPAEELEVPLPASDDVEAKSSELEESSSDQQSSPAATTETGESKVPPAEELEVPLPASDDVEAKSSELEESSAEQQSSPAATTETGESKVPPAEELEVPLPASDDVEAKSSELEESSAEQQSSPAATTETGESKVPPAEELEVPLPASDDVEAKSSELEESSAEQQSSPAATTETGESKVPPAEELEVPLPASDDVEAKSSELEESSAEQQSSPAATTETGESKVPPAEELEVPLPASDDVEAKSSELEESSAEQQSSPAATTETGESKVPPAEELEMPLPASDDVEAKSSELEESSAEHELEDGSSDQQSSPAATTETGEAQSPAAEQLEVVTSTSDDVEAEGSALQDGSSDQQSSPTAATETGEAQSPAAEKLEAVTSTSDDVEAKGSRLEESSAEQQISTATTETGKAAEELEVWPSLSDDVEAEGSELEGSSSDQQSSPAAMDETEVAPEDLGVWPSLSDDGEVKGSDLEENSSDPVAEGEELEVWPSLSDDGEAEGSQLDESFADQQSSPVATEETGETVEELEVWPSLSDDGEAKCSELEEAKLSELEERSADQQISGAATDQTKDSPEGVHTKGAQAPSSTSDVTVSTSFEQQSLPAVDEVDMRRDSQVHGSDETALGDQAKTVDGMSGRAGGAIERSDETQSTDREPNVLTDEYLDTLCGDEDVDIGAEVYETNEEEVSNVAMPIPSREGEAALLTLDPSNDSDTLLDSQSDPLMLQGENSDASDDSAVLEAAGSDDEDCVVSSEKRNSSHSLDENPSSLDEALLFLERDVSMDFDNLPSPSSPRRTKSQALDENEASVAEDALDLLRLLNDGNDEIPETQQESGDLTKRDRDGGEGGTSEAETTPRSPRQQESVVKDASPGSQEDYECSDKSGTQSNDIIEPTSVAEGGDRIQAEASDSTSDNGAVQRTTEKHVSGSPGNVASVELDDESNAGEKNESPRRELRLTVSGAMETPDKDLVEGLADAVTPIARGRSVVDGTTPDGNLLDMHALPLAKSSASLKRYSEDAERESEEATTPSASNLTKKFSMDSNNAEQQSDQSSEDDLLDSLHDHAQGLANMGNPEALKSNESMPEMDENSSNLPQDSFGEESLVGAESRNLPPAPEEDISGPEGVEEFRDAGDLDLSDALAGPSWVGPKSAHESFDAQESFDENLSRPKKIEFSSSVASVSSTISANSARQTPNSTVPAIPMDVQSQGTQNKQMPFDRGDSAHSALSGSNSVQSFRSRSTKPDTQDQDGFAETLATKLESATAEEVTSRWLNKTQEDTFDPSESVFASFLEDENDSSDISEPGSPPEPIYGEDSSFSSSDDESDMREVVARTAAVWDMIPRTNAAREKKTDNPGPNLNLAILSDEDDESQSAVPDFGPGKYTSAAATKVSASIPASDMSVMSASTAGRSKTSRRGVSRKLSIEFLGPKKGGRKKMKYRYDPSRGFRATNEIDDGSLAAIDDDDISGVFSIAGGSVVDSRSRRASFQNKNSALTVSVMNDKKRNVLLEKEARARERGKATTKKNKTISLDAFFSSNKQNADESPDASESSSAPSAQGGMEDIESKGEESSEEPSEEPMQDDLAGSQPEATGGSVDEAQPIFREESAVGESDIFTDGKPPGTTRSEPLDGTEGGRGPVATTGSAKVVPVYSMDLGDEEDRFEDCLREFCSPLPITSPLASPAAKSETNKEGAARWQQLQARWKHAEIMQAITSRYPTRQYLTTHQSEPKNEEDDSIDSDFPPKMLNFNLLSDVDISDRRWKNRDGYHPHHTESTLPISSGFIFRLGKSPIETISLKHKIPTEPSEDKTAKLLEKASSYRAKFTALLEELVDFASPQLRETGSRSLCFSENIKSRDSILRKAKQKYQDDVLLVKDVLRGQIMFPDEGALVCALVKLEQLCREPQKLGETDDTTSLSVERAKNSFLKDGSGRFKKSNLPTGYRHVLINISFDGEFLAEIQCHLTPLFDVLGEDGRALHLRLSYGSGSLVPSGSEILFTGLIDRVVHEEEPSTSRASGSRVKLPIEMHKQTEGDGGAADVNVLSSYFSQETTFEPIPPKGDLQDAIRAMIAEGVKSIEKHPHDISNMHCLLNLLSEVLSHQVFDPSKTEKVDKQYMEFFRDCLCRCLDLFDQTNSSSMFGWLSVDESKPLDRLSERPLELLHELGCVYATFGQWHDAEEIFRSLLSRCENHFPLYHPRVLSSMFDVAIAARKNASYAAANDLLGLALDRISSYLSEMERTHMVHQGQATEALQAGGSTTQHDFGRASLQMMESFASILQYLLERRLVGIVSAANDVVLLHYCLIGDATAVLANCLKVSENAASHEETNFARANDSKYYWRLAFSHYRIAFKGYSTTDRNEKPLVALACSAYGSARSLRELGEPGKALQLLSIVMGSLLPKSPGPLMGSRQKMSIGSIEPSVDISFLPHVVSSGLVQTMQSESQRFVVASYCLWLMAVLTVDTKPNEEGRVHSLKLLHKASVSLQYALKILHTSSQDNRSSCIELLRKIEDEAKSIIRPLRPPSRIPTQRMMRGVGLYQGAR